MRIEILFKLYCSISQIAASNTNQSNKKVKTNRKRMWARNKQLKIVRQFKDKTFQFIWLTRNMRFLARSIRKTDKRTTKKIHGEWKMVVLILMPCHSMSLLITKFLNEEIQWSRIIAFNQCFRSECVSICCCWVYTFLWSWYPWFGCKLP